MFGKNTTILYLGEKERDTWPILCYELRFMSEVFYYIYGIYNTDSVDVLKVLWCHKLETLLYLCWHISPKLMSVVLHGMDWGYGETLQIVTWTQSMRSSWSPPCLSCQLFLSHRLAHTHVLWFEKANIDTLMPQMKSHVLLALNFRSNKF